MPIQLELVDVKDHQNHDDDKSQNEHGQEHWSVKVDNDGGDAGGEEEGSSLTDSQPSGDITAKEEPFFSLKALKSVFVQNQTSFIAGLIAAILLIILQSTSWHDLGWGGWFTIWITALSMGLLINGVVGPEIALWLNTACLLAVRVIDVKQAFSAFSNDSIVTIGLMMIVVYPLEVVGGTDYIARFVMGDYTTEFKVQLRMMLITAFVSAFTNNTPQVAVMIPVLQQWCRKFNQPPSKYMMPMSYAAILGGLCTIIGTSTNLIVSGLVKDAFPTDPSKHLTFWEIGAVGVPMSLAGILYCSLFARWLLPIRQAPAMDVIKNERNYLSAVRVLESSGVIGLSIEDAGLRHLKKIFIVEIQRKNGEVIAAPPAETVIQANDRLYFAGEVTAVKDLWRTEGFAADGGGIGSAPKAVKGERRVLIEAVLSRYADCIGKTVRAAHFQSRYGAAIIAVHRLGNHVPGGIGGIELQGGDHLLLDTYESVHERLASNPDFALATIIDTDETTNPTAKRKNLIRLVLASLFLLALVITNSAEDQTDIPLATSAVVCIFLMLGTGILTPGLISKAIPGNLLLAVTGAFGVAKALETTGVAAKIADAIIGGFGGHGIGALFAIYLSTVLTTAVLSNGASVALSFPVALAICEKSGMSIKAFAYVIALAASADFSTPIGYQTNLMVSGPGGYQFLDYTKFGVPLQIICMLVSVPLCYAYWI